MYRYYQLPFELQDRLSVIQNNSIERNLNMVKHIDESQSLTFDFKDFDLTGNDYVVTPFTVPSLVLAKDNLSGMIRKRNINVNNRISNPVRDASGFIVSEVNNEAEFQYAFADPALYNRNSLIIIRLKADFTKTAVSQIPIGASVVIDLNGFTMTCDYSAFSTNKNSGFLSIFNGTLKIGLVGGSLFNMIDIGLGIVPSISCQFFPYDIMGISSSADKKLIIDLDNKAVDFYIMMKNFMIKTFITPEMLSFINDGSALGKHIGYAYSYNVNVNVTNIGNYSLIADVLANRIPSGFYSNLLFTI